MFRDTMYLPVETLQNPFVETANIQTIEAFMNRVGYQGVVDIKKEAIQYHHFIKLIIADLMMKFSNAPKRLEEDYHSIKDDVTLEYEKVFMMVDVPMEQPPIVSTQGTNRGTPRALRSYTVSASPHEKKKRKQIVGESSSPSKSLKVTIKQKKIVEEEKDDDEYKNRLEPRSHKENPKVVDDDDDNKKEKVAEKKDDDMGSLETRTEETQITIPTLPSSPRKILSSDKEINQELTDDDRADDITLWEALRHKFEKFSTSNTSCWEDDFHSYHDEHQDDDAPLEGEKSMKRSKESKRSKSARGSSSNHSKQILVMRANNKPNSFSEANFKYLNKNDIEDLYYLCQSRKVDNRERCGHFKDQEMDCGAWKQILGEGGESLWCLITCASDVFDEYLQMSEHTAQDALFFFNMCIIELYMLKYLRKLTSEDICHGNVNMAGVIKKYPTIMLEAVSLQDLWIWHAFYGIAGTNNDINVLDNFSLFDDLLDDLAHVVPYGVATDPKHTYLKHLYESARKDVERAFGVLQGHWGLIQQLARAYEVNTLRRIVYAGIILHNMILEDQNMSIVGLNHVYSNPARSMQTMWIDRCET
uniref:Uncharacterized protein n=1 Tax=Tanacetum cinerariifolium TaxID=118510 RepID=A0A6L2LS34_TANCI|nr:hypothetical protein [Tanacetum cinerariifolium]